MDNGLNENKNQLENENQSVPVQQNDAAGTVDASAENAIVEVNEAATKKKKAAWMLIFWLIGRLFVWLWKFIKLCWRHKKASLIGLFVIALLVVALLVTRCVNESDTSLSLGINRGIEATPTVLTEVKNIGQWEFLSISDEEMIDTVRKGFFSDDELIRIYYGTLRLGIDFSQCEGEWIRTDGDSIILDLPPVKLLDDDFLDETRTQSFIENGKWTNADRQAMAERAKVAMRNRCLTKENLALAQKNADRQLRDFLKKIKEKNITND